MDHAERLLEAVIADARTKQADILYWKRTPNGRVIVEITNRFPLYFLNPVAAADSLIHQYNLIAKYRHLYQRANNVALPVHPEPSPSVRLSLEERAIEYCDEAIFWDSADLNLNEKKRILRAIQKTLSGSNYKNADFYTVRNALIDRYKAMSNNAASPIAQKKLRKMIRYYETLRYADVIDHY